MGDTSNVTETVSQADLCYRELRKLVVTCELAPGTRLNEKALIERLGFGRTPVRESLMRLTRDRLVETRQRSGYTVRALTRKSIADVLLVWKEIAPLIVAAGFEHISPERKDYWRDRLKQSGDQDRDRPQITCGLDIEFFKDLVDLSENEPLALIYDHLSANLERITIVLADIAQMNGLVGTNDAILGLLSEEDPQIAAAKARARLQEANRSLLNFLDKREIVGVEGLSGSSTATIARGRSRRS